MRSLQMLQQAIERVGKIDRAAVIKDLQTGSFDTVIGKVKLENNMPTRFWWVGQWQDGEFYGIAPAGNDGARKPRSCRSRHGWLRSVHSNAAGPVMTNAILTGLMLGGMYALIAMGLTLQYGVARIMNLSYGEFLIAAAFASHWLFTGWAISPFVGLALVVPLAFVLNLAIYKVLLTPLVRRAPNRDALEVDSILATFGLTFVIQGSMLALFGGAYYSYSYLAFPVQFVGETVAANRLAALGITVILGLALYLALTRTRAGTAVRAVAVDPFAAQLVAINVPQASALTFALGGALVAAAGVLVSTFLTFSASSGVVFTMKALIVVVMGGVGNMLGCLVAGLALGLSEALVASYVDPGLTLAVNFALFLAVLLVKPAGLFGRATR